MAEPSLRRDLSEVFLEQGIQDTHFFNGRLLTAEDLEHIQDASRRRDHQLGLALGTGVVSGLEVRLVKDGTDNKPPVLAVSKGLAITPLGGAVALAQDAEVLLAKEKPGKIPEAGMFDYCLPLQQDNKPLPGKGVYIFTIRPASDYQGLAPRRGFGQAAKVEGCDRDLLLEGAQFRFLSIDIDQLDNVAESTRTALKDLLKQTEQAGQTGFAAQNKLRNWLAHVCFGTEELAAFIADPFSRPSGISPFESYGAVDTLRKKGLIDDCDVPLALVCWTSTGVKWVDMWSVRRRPMPPGRTMFWPLPISARRIAEGEALFYQFQSQIDDLVSTAKTASFLNLMIGRNNFRYLPPAGFLPLIGPKTNFGYTAQQFFLNVKVRSLINVDERLYSQGSAIMALVNESLLYPSIDLENPELVWVYRVRENQFDVDTGTPPVTRPYVIFANGHIPYRGDARFDLGYWEYSNFA